MPIFDRSLKVGPLDVPNRVFLAPMSGVTDLPFRRLAARHGAGLVVSEMVASREFCKADPESRKRALLLDEEAGLRAVQIAGREARWMADAAKIAADFGADIVDINMGCPAKKVTGGLSGSALMRDLDHAMALIEATVEAVSIPVTLKMRLGWDVASLNAPELARRAEAAGIQMVTVHGRTRCQFYKGQADWNAVSSVRDATHLPLVVNGDIGDLASAEKAMTLSGADAVMVGRAAYGRPWLPGHIAVGCCDPEPWLPVASTLVDYIVLHYEAMLAHYGHETGVRHARKHLGWYIDAHFAKTLSVSDLKAVILRDSDYNSVVRHIGKLADAPRSYINDTSSTRFAA